MNKKYFFFDIDGTLTDRCTGKAVPSAVQALKKLQEAGHFVALCTGRAQYKARPFLESVGLDNMVCAGGACLVLDGKICQNIPLDLEKAKQVIAQAEELGYGVLTAIDDSQDVYSSNDLFREQCGPRQEPTTYIVDSQFDPQKLEAIFKIYISIPEQEEYRLTTRSLLGHLRFVPAYLMFQYDAKRQGIIDMMEKLGGPLADVVVFGDDSNDLVMFDPLWTSIAMGNATRELKEKADYVTDTNVNDGIDKACRYFGFYERC